GLTPFPVLYRKRRRSRHVLASRHPTRWTIPCDAVIRVYDEAGNVIETHEQAGEFKEAQIFGNTDPAVKVRTIKRIRGQPGGRFRIYNDMRKFSVRLVNGPQRIWRGRTVVYLHLPKSL